MPAPRLFLLFLLMIICCSGPAWRAEAQKKVWWEDLILEQYPTVDPVTRLFQDSKGLVWVGTTNGIFRYDGYTMDRFSQDLVSSDPGFRGTVVSAITEDKAGKIWMGMQFHGLNIYDPATGLFTQVLYTPDSSIHIKAVAPDRDNGIWALVDGALVRVQEKDHAYSIAVHALEGNPVLENFIVLPDDRFLLLGEGLIWVCLENNTLRVEKRLRYEKGMALLHIDQDEFLFSSRNQLYHYKDDQVTLTGLDLGGQVMITSVERDHRGTYWAGHNRGFVRFRLDRDNRVTDMNKYHGMPVVDVLRDSAGNLFLSMWGKGLYKLGWSYEKYTYISLPKAFSNAYVYNFIDEDSVYWVGTTEGLLKYDAVNNRFDEGTVAGSEPGRQIHSIILARDNSLYYATRNGVVRLLPDRRTIQKIAWGGGVSHNLAEDALGNVYFVQENRLGFFNPENDSLQFPFLNDSTFGYLQKFTYDPARNKIWSFSNTSGLVGVDDATHMPEVLIGPESPYFQHLTINWMVMDAGGKIWLSSAVGILVIDPETKSVLRHLNRNNLLFMDDSFEMIPGVDGQMWVKQGSYGFISIDPYTFTRVSYKPEWLVDPAGRSPNISDTGKDGRLFTEGWGGFFLFHPDSVKDRGNPPQMYLADMVVNDSLRYHSGEKRTFSHEQNNVLIRFAGIHFDSPERNMHAFRLVGHDEQWQLTGAVREARFASLPPGEYVFMAKASNPDGVWSDETELARFIILPPWWKTPWAYLLYAVIFLVLAFLTWRTQLNRKLARAEAQRLREMDEFKNAFFTNVTHEFRTPLTVILGLADKTGGRAGVLIRRNAHQLLRRVNQILELARLDTQTIREMTTEGDVIRFIRYQVQALASLAQEKGLALHVSAEGESMVRFDDDKIGLIVNNLVSNAIKYTDDGSIEVMAAYREGSLFLEVSDTGVGIPKEEVRRVFERHYKATNNPGNVASSGIGLSLVKELVDYLGGEIMAESDPGQGSAFRVRLPLEPAGDQLPAEVAELPVSESSDNRDTVLVVEDNADIREMLGGMLQPTYQVIFASEGRTGLEMATGQIPDLIVSDLMMPEMTGTELASKVKNDERTSHIPFILLTAKADRDSRIGGLETGADVFLAKPVGEKELLLHLRNLLKLRDTIRNSNKERIDEAAAGVMSDPFLENARKCVLENLDNSEYGIEEIGQALGVSRTQLHRKLKALTGLSASHFIRDIRLAEGRKLLRTTRMNVAEVAYAVGFSDPNYFSRLFSGKFSLPPSAIRNVAAGEEK